jgi:UTP-glucose-1-phosphate uridylyltransferase
VGRRFDCGDKFGYLEAILALASEREDLRSGFTELLTRYVR